MSSEYLFQNDYLGVSDHKIHFLRNRFEYDAVPFKEIEGLRFKRGKAIKNGFILLIFAIFF